MPRSEQAAAAHKDPCSQTHRIKGRDQADHGTGDTRQNHCPGGDQERTQYRPDGRFQPENQAEKRQPQGAEDNGKGQRCAGEAACLWRLRGRSFILEGGCGRGLRFPLG